MSVPRRLYIVIRTETPTPKPPSYEIKRVHTDPDLIADPPNPGKATSRFLVTSEHTPGSVRVQIEYDIDTPEPAAFEWHVSKLEANLIALHERDRIEHVATRWKKLKKTFTQHRDDNGRFYITETKSEEVDDDGNLNVSSGKTVWFDVVRVVVDDVEGTGTGAATTEETESEDTEAETEVEESEVEETEVEETEIEETDSEEM